MRNPISDDNFKIKITISENVDIYLSCLDNTGIAWPLVRALDQGRIRAIGDVSNLNSHAVRAQNIMKRCSGFITVLHYISSESSTTSPCLLSDLKFAAGLGIPLLIFRENHVHMTTNNNTRDRLNLQFGDSEPIPVDPGQVYELGLYMGKPDKLDERQIYELDRFCLDVRKNRGIIPSYAFLIGRLERDFAHARAAIRSAVESEAGIPCLWSDDGYQANIDSVHKRTQLLIRHAAFVIADLTLGPESPDRENPSRAHEIGMAIAFNRKMMLCSQEPRRYPYFSIGDMQMTFWSTEAELAIIVKQWIHANMECVGRVVYNYRLAESYPDYDADLRRSSFIYDPKQRFVGPKTPGSKI